MFINEQKAIFTLKTGKINMYSVPRLNQILPWMHIHRFRHVDIFLTRRTRFTHPLNIFIQIRLQQEHRG